MKWIRKGLIYTPDGSYPWSKTHAQVPKPFLVNEDRLRIYFGTRDLKNRTYTSFIEVNPVSPSKIIEVNDKPVMSLGADGSFDDAGIMPGSFILHDNSVYMYYTGWSLKEHLPYNVEIGLAISKDKGISFERYSENAIIGKNYEPISCSQPFVMKEKNKWKMWYSSFAKWESINGKDEPFYNIKYAESLDGISWIVKGITSIDYSENTDAAVNPWVWQEEGIWKMLYSYRGSKDYRSSLLSSYVIGYAESVDSVSWVRKDKEAGISKSKEGWDSEMIAYPSLYFYKGKKYLLYNGNGFGRTGFGYAISA